VSERVMGLLADIIELLVGSRAIFHPPRVLMRRGILLVTLACVGFVMLLIGFGFLAGAVYQLVQIRLRPDLAMLVVGAGALLLAVLAGLMMFLELRSKSDIQSPIATLADEGLRMAVAAGSMIAPGLAGMKRRLARNAPSLVVFSLCAGLVSGVVLRNRRR